jgi:hypothetical protein
MYQKHDELNETLVAGVDYTMIAAHEDYKALMRLFQKRESEVNVNISPHIRLK